MTEIKYVKGVNYDYSSKPKKNMKFKVGEIYGEEDDTFHFCPVEHVSSILGYFENPNQVRFLVITPLENFYCDAIIPDLCTCSKMRIDRELTLEEVINLDQTGNIKRRVEDNRFN